MRQVERKLYWLIVPFLAIDYAFYYIDKTTLSYAALFGIKKDLDLQGEDYSNLSSIFYIGWLVWAIPGNLLLAKFPLAKYLSFNVSTHWLSHLKFLPRVIPLYPWLCVILTRRFLDLSLGCILGRSSRKQIISRHGGLEIRLGNV